MSINSSSTTNSLDRIRETKGIHALEDYFDKLIENNRKEATNLVNDENLHFASLFVLRVKISEANLIDYLSFRNKLALEFINEILTGKKDISVMDYISSDYTQIVYSILKWIFETGSFDDGLSNEYDEVLDIAAILLTKLYNEQKIIPTIINMIFNRNRRDYFIHDLVWAFFEAKDPYSLVMVANRLLSSEEKDVSLANKLLSFIPKIGKNQDSDNQKKYADFLNWIEENSLFLYSTGQSLQQTNNPMPYAVDLDAKYLCKYISVNSGKTLKSLTEREQHLIEDFKKLDSNIKELLSSFSSIMHNKNFSWWNTWINKPISEQINIAKTMIGGEQ